MDFASITLGSSPHWVDERVALDESPPSVAMEVESKGSPAENVGEIPESSSVIGEKTKKVVVIAPVDVKTESSSAVSESCKESAKALISRALVTLTGTHTIVVEVTTGKEPELAPTSKQAVVRETRREEPVPQGENVVALSPEIEDVWDFPLKHVLMADFA